MILGAYRVGIMLLTRPDGAGPSINLRQDFQTSLEHMKGLRHIPLPGGGGYTTIGHVNVRSMSL